MICVDPCHEQCENCRHDGERANPAPAIQTKTKSELEDAMWNMQVWILNACVVL